MSPPIRFVQVNTFYPAYLRDFYATRPDLQTASFAAHIDALLDDGFSGPHMMTRELARAGWETTQIVANAAPAQRAWLADNELTLPEPLDGALVAGMQLQLLQPDIVYFTDPVLFDSRFIRKLPSRPRLVTGWRGWDIPRGTDWSEFDAIFTSFDRIMREAPQFGARDVCRHFPGIPRDAPFEEPPAYDRDVVFSGSVTPLHATRIKALELVWRASLGHDGGAPFSFDLFMPDVSMFPPEMRSRNKGSVWGNAMLRTLARSRVTVNIAVDGFDVQPPNMRVIEATGAGAFLITNQHPDLVKFFTPGAELATFASAQELIDKIRYYIAHDGERRAIARAGAARCRRDHGLAQTAAQFRDMLTAKLPAK